MNSRRWILRWLLAFSRPCELFGLGKELWKPE